MKNSQTFFKKQIKLRLLFVGAILFASLSLFGVIPSACFAVYQLGVALLYLLASKITV